MSQIGLNSQNTNINLPPTSLPDHPSTIHNSNATVRSGLTEVSETPNKQREDQNGNAEPGLPPTPPMRSLLCTDDEVNQEGYDSDGRQGPFFDGVEEEGMLVGDDEEEAGLLGVEVGRIAENSENRVELSLDMVSKLKVVELRNELKKRVASIKGKKEELVSRLKRAIENGMPYLEKEGTEKNHGYASEGFPLGAKWELEEDYEDVLEQEDDGLIEDVDDEVDEIDFQNKKNFRLQIDRPPFISYCDQPQQVSNQVDPRDKYQYTSKLHNSRDLHG